MSGNWRSTLLAFDTSSIIHAWDHYPLKQFPGLWKWLGEESNAGRFVMSAIAYDETKQRDTDCHAWLHQQRVNILAVTQQILEDALQIKKALGIADDRYKTGVGENDLLIIATCMQGHIELVSNEGVQNQLPKNLANYKIPAVCGMQTVNVPCIDFRRLLVRSGRVF
jgi:predicted nucleic acid-binding protein